MDRHNPELLFWMGIIGIAGGILFGCGQWLIGSLLSGVAVLYALNGIVDTNIRDITSMKERNIIGLLYLMCASFFLLRSGVSWEVMEWLLLVIAGIFLAAVGELIARCVLIFRCWISFF